MLPEEGGGKLLVLSQVRTSASKELENLATLNKSVLIWQPLKLKDGIQEAILNYFNTFHKHVLIEESMSSFLK